MVVIIPNVFVAPNQPGDFSWMISRFPNALFLFNDNIEDHLTYKTGGGNAAIRPYNQFNPRMLIPRSAGIPTGSKHKGGFTSLDPTAKKYIDEAFKNIRKLCKTHKYKSIYYSTTPSGEFGTGIFTVGDDVKKYILQSISDLKKKRIE